MPPQNTSVGSVVPEDLRERIKDTTKEGVKDETKQEKEWNYFDHLYPVNIFWFILLHIGALYGAKLVFTEAKFATFVFAFVIYKFSLFGITAGVHRLWSHRAYRARFPLRVFLAMCNSMSYQNSIYEWARDHRVHHKYTETDADPVNSKRGFFFSHVGWLLCKKHPDVQRIGGRVDMSDILADPVVYYQKKYYVPSVVLFWLVFPMAAPVYFWGETAWNSFFVAVVLRYCFALNATWAVNSAAHMWGDRPYDKNIAPAENIVVSALTLGEGYHNFHHSFPWDYSTSEWGWRINLTTIALDFFEKVGLIYDVKRVTPEMVKARMKRTGKDSKTKEVVEEHEYMWIDK